MNFNSTTKNLIKCFKGTNEQAEGGDSCCGGVPTIIFPENDRPKQENKPKQPPPQKSKIQVGSKVKHKATGKTGKVVSLSPTGDILDVDWDDGIQTEAVEHNVKASDVIVIDDKKSKGDGEGEGEGEGKGGETGKGETGKGENSDEQGDDAGEAGEKQSTPIKQSSPRQKQPVEVRQSKGTVNDDFSETPPEPADPEDKSRLRDQKITEEEKRQIFDNAQRQSGRGTGSGGGVLFKLSELLTPNTDWKPHLRKFLRLGTIKPKYTSTYRVPRTTSIATGIPFPKDIRRKEIVDRVVVVAIDTSGSVFEKRFLSRFFGEVLNITKTEGTKVLLIPWSDHVDRDNVMMLTKADSIQKLSKANLTSGGTRISGVAEYLMEPEQKNLIKTIAGIIYITDLEVEIPFTLVPGKPTIIFGPEELLKSSTSAINWCGSQGIPVIMYTEEVQV